MEENEARLFYKNKYTKMLYLLSYIFLGLFGIVFTLVSAIALIVENGAGASSFLYVTLGLGFLSLLLSIIVICMAFIKENDGFSVARIKAISILKLILRTVNTISSLLLLIGTFAVSIGYDVGNDSWGDFVRIFAIASLVIEATMSLYSIWKLAWRKENPERYAPGFIVEKNEEKSHYVATKKDSSKEEKKKEKHHLLSSKQKAKEKDEIKQIEEK